MKAHAIVYNLLESEEIEDPKAFLGQAMQSARERWLAKFPSELRDLFQKADTAFLEAMGNPKKSAAWDATNPDEMDWWPELVEGYAPAAPWAKHKYYTEFEIQAQHLILHVINVPETGERAIVESMSYSPQNLDLMRFRYSHRRWLDRMLFYTSQVMRFGQDPLKFFPEVPVPELKELAGAASRKYKLEYKTCQLGYSKVVP